MFKTLKLQAKFATLFYAVSLGAMLIVGWYGYENAKSSYMKGALDLAKGYTSEVSVHIGDFIKRMLRTDNEESMTYKKVVPLQQLIILKPA